MFCAFPRKFFILAFAVCGTFVLFLALVGSGKAATLYAVWYGPGFEGATTASGEPFNPNDYTTAHKTLPFGTKLIVTYGGHSVVVRVNDRGPYVDGEDLDLSQATAEYLDLTTVGGALVDVVSADPSAPTGPYADGALMTQRPAVESEQQSPGVANQYSAESQYSAPQVQYSEAAPAIEPNASIDQQGAFGRVYPSVGENQYDQQYGGEDQYTGEA
ncbi:MAG: septal ring lytic transglycosylase RlpA family protein [Actinomycetota bacterium]|nr:septal ring lytic transglycosylase RlpA family protein [Actinomycetota bacterium]